MSKYEEQQGLLRTLAAKNAVLSLDVQGLLWKVEGGVVRLEGWPEKKVHPGIPGKASVIR